jgi:hypothetical protein
MRYYFDIRNGVPIRDRNGSDFESNSAAILHAKKLAADLRAGQEYVTQDMRVCVINEHGSVVHEESVAEKTQPRG